MALWHLAAMHGPGLGEDSAKYPDGEVIAPHTFAAGWPPSAFTQMRAVTSQNLCRDIPDEAS
jgi:hypothetical protein